MSKGTNILLVISVLATTVIIVGCWPSSTEEDVPSDNVNEQEDADMQEDMDAIDACDEEISGFLINEEDMCAAEEIFLACRNRIDHPIAVATYGCYISDATDQRVFTYHQYGELPDAGWQQCDSDYLEAFIALGHENWFCDGP